jgi:iron complex outermembrane receptor protein
MAFPASTLVFLLSVLAADESAPPPPLPAPAVREHVTVHATRLTDQEVPLEQVPAEVTVITREEIERSGASTLQDVLALETGVLVHDQVGNDLEKTLDLRGFTRGTGTAVFVDGVRQNDPRNNAFTLEALPLEAVDRVEVTRGSAAGLNGGGTEAGVIHVLTRRGESFGGSLRAAAGSDGARKGSAYLGGRAGKTDLFASLGHDGGDGFRARNGDSDVDRFAAGAGRPFGAHRLDFTAMASRLQAGAPGALTPEEFAADPWQNQYNLVDGNEAKSAQASLAYQGSFGNLWSVASDVYARGVETELLTTGRAAAAGFSGFFLDGDTRLLGSGVQTSRRGQRASTTAGVEWSQGRADDRGWLTDPPDYKPPAGSAPDSDNRTERRSFAVFVRQSLTPTPHWTLQAGLRSDRDRTEYQDHLDATKDAARSFSQVTGRAGLTWNPDGRNGLWVAYAQSFLAPTAEQLFAFPLFGSNPDLEPQRSSSVELGYRVFSGDSFELTTALFRTDTRDEVVFVPNTDPGSPSFGRNENAGESRRDGLSASVKGRIADRVSWFLRATALDATFRTGPDAGKDIPLVPDLTAAAGIDVDLGSAWLVHLDVLHVGEQVLDNDNANARTPLPDFTLVNARVVWQAVSALRLFVEGRNVLDEIYATRGIFGFDFVSNRPDAFWTPAPGRRFLAGAQWTF